jgi:putative endonuclease
MWPARPDPKAAGTVGAGVNSPGVNSSGATTRGLGQLHESRALAHLQQAGLTLVLRNYTAKVGEIDLIMSDADALVFVEVRFRSANSFVDGLSTVGDSKRKRFIKAVKYYLLTHPKDAERVLRFDVMSMSMHDIDWHKNAFDAGSGW